MIKKIIGDIFSRPFFQPFFEGVLNFSLKVLNIGDGHSVETSGEKIAFDILYKINSDKEAMVFDVGAHTGEWYKLFKQYYKGKAKVYSFEPSSESYEKLSEIKDNDFYPVNFALGNITEDKYLSDKGETSAYISNEKENEKTSEKIKIITLDEYCNKNNIKNIDLLKLDVEGYELKVLAGAKKMLENNSIKTIQFEFGAPSPEKYTLKDFFDILGDKYEICRILKNGYFPVKYKHYFEILTVTNFIAIKKDLI